MNGFWKSLSEVAQGQLFNGGYLSHEAVTRLQTNRPRGKTARASKNKQARKLPWPRLAIPH
jgi:hypothetical protein